MPSNQHKNLSMVFRPTINAFSDYFWAFIFLAIFVFIFTCIAIVNPQNIENRIIAIPLILLFSRPLYRGFETILTREVSSLDHNTLQLRIGFIKCKVKKNNCYVALENSPTMVYGIKNMHWGFSVYLIRNERFFLKRLFKNKLILYQTLRHRKSEAFYLQEAEQNMEAIKNLLGIRDDWQVRREKFHST